MPLVHIDYRAEEYITNSRGDGEHIMLFWCCNITTYYHPYIHLASLLHKNIIILTGSVYV